MLSFPNWTNGTCYGSKSNATFVDCGSELLVSVKFPQRAQPAAASDVVVVVIGIPGSERGPYHMIEPFRNLAISAVHYPNGMTLEEAEAFVELHHG
jgi:hypothetical protein